jgi:hypothetical protein
LVCTSVCTAEVQSQLPASLKALAAALLALSTDERRQLAGLLLVSLAGDVSNQLPANFLHKPQPE